MPDICRGSYVLGTACGACERCCDELVGIVRRLRYVCLPTRNCCDCEEYKKKTCTLGEVRDLLEHERGIDERRRH